MFVHFECVISTKCNLQFWEKKNLILYTLLKVKRTFKSHIRSVDAFNHEDITQMKESWEYINIYHRQKQIQVLPFRFKK